MKPILYLVRALPGGRLDRLGRLFEVRGGHARPLLREALLHEAHDAEVLVPTYIDRVDEQLLAGLPRLRHLASYGVGTNHIDLDSCRRRRILVTNTPEVLTDATADHALALLLAAARRVAEGDRLLRRGEWRGVDPGWMLGIEVTGKTLGVIGFGRIGQAVARRAQGFGMRILYASPREARVQAARRVSLEELLAGSDFVSVHCPLTPATENLLSRDRLALLRPGAVVVNTARGPLIDDDALADALESGRVAAAGLDVFRDEPHVPARYLRLENVVLTPHLGSGTRETRAAMAEMVAAEVERVAEGAHPLHRVV